MTDRIRFDAPAAEPVLSGPIGGMGEAMVHAVAKRIGMWCSTKPFIGMARPQWRYNADPVEWSTGVVLEPTHIAALRQALREAARARHCLTSDDRVVMGDLKCCDCGKQCAELVEGVRCSDCQDAWSEH